MTRIQIKGIRDGLLVTCSAGDWAEIRQALLDELDEKADFFRGARMALDVGEHALRAVELSQLRNEIADRQITLWAVLSQSLVTEQTAQTLGLETQLSRPRPEPEAMPIETRLQQGDDALLVRRTLRSGFSMQHAGHVVVLGDVNPGAEIIAGGSVIVWGRLRGMVHAGAEGDENAVVCALDLSPTQLRIAGVVALTPKRKGKPQPEMAHLVNGQVLAEPWDPKKRELL